MLPHTLLAPALTYIFAKMNDIHNCALGHWQRQFLCELFRVVFAMHGRINFTNLARYSFFCSATGKAQPGLEASILGIVATKSRRAFGLDVTQTPAEISATDAAAYSRLDFYIEQIVDLYERLADVGVCYWVGDRYYAKQKVFEEVARWPDQPPVHVLTTLANSPHLGRNLRIVLLRVQQFPQPSTHTD